MTDKIRKAIYFPPEFIPLIVKGQLIFKRTQHQSFRFFLNKIPVPYSIGSEIQFRFIEYRKLKDLVMDLINNFVPELMRNEYLILIPLSPLETLQNNGQGIQDYF